MLHSLRNNTTFLSAVSQTFESHAPSQQNSTYTNNTVTTRHAAVEMWLLKFFFKMCVMIGRKVGQGHPDDCVCNDSVRNINQPNINAGRKLICMPEEITEN